MSEKRISFDRVSNVYDLTRAMPPEMEKSVLNALIDYGGIDSNSRVLELGVGTGRIAGPISDRIPTQYFGIDISLKMMDKIKEKKHNRVNLVCGDVCALPFKSHSFDAVLAVHVFHLICDWHCAIRETLRVMSQQGVMIVAGEGASKTGMLDLFMNGIKPEAKQELFSITQKLNLRQNMVGMTDMDEAANLLKKLGASVTLPPQIEHVMEVPLSIMLAFMQGRVFTALWEVPDNVLSEAVSEMRRVFEKYYGDLNTRIPLMRRFKIVRAAL